MPEYNNYLNPKTTSKFTSRNALVNVQRIRTQEIRDFIFQIVPEASAIYAQADKFATYFVAEGRLSSSFMDNANRLDTPRSMLRDTYVYSYLKALYYAYGRDNGNVYAMTGPKNNLAFHGHKILHDMIIEGLMQQFGSSSSIINLQVSISEENISSLQDFEVWKESYDAEQNLFFSSKFETVLGFLNNTCSDIVTIGNIGEIQDTSARNVAASPLGNLAYSSNMSQLMYIENNAITSDRVSFFWNKAVMISAVQIPTIDADDEIYDTVNTDDYDPICVMYEVEAITGYNPLNEVRTSWDIRSSGGGGGDGTRPVDDTTPNGPRPGSSSSALNSRANKPGSRNFYGVKIEKVVNKVVKLKDGAVNLFNTGNKLLDEPLVIIAADIITDLTGKNVKVKTMRKLIGWSIADIFAKFHLELDIEGVDDTGDYAAYYLDREGNKISLSGVQRTIRDK